MKLIRKTIGSKVKKIKHSRVLLLKRAKQMGIHRVFVSIGLEAEDFNDFFENDHPMIFEEWS